MRLFGRDSSAPCGAGLLSDSDPRVPSRRSSGLHLWLHSLVPSGPRRNGDALETWRSLGNVWHARAVGAITVLVLAQSTVPTFGQLEGPAPVPRDMRAVDAGPGRADAPRAALDDPDVYVNDSFESSDALAKAQVLISRERWGEAAQVLQKAMDREDRRLVRVERGSYTGIRRHIGSLIAKWPRAGLSEYRRLFDGELSRALRDIHDPNSLAELSGLFERYFCTSGAAELADRIGQLAIESGNLAWAEPVYRRVLEQHPDAKAYRNRYQAMLDLMAAMRGEEPTGGFEARAEVPLKWKGAERSVREIVKEINAGAWFKTASAVQEWSVWGGDGTRNRTASCSVDDPGLMWRFSFVEPKERKDGAVDKDQEASLAELAKETSIFPVIGGGLAFLQWGREIAAVQRTTGAAAWRFGENPTRTGGLDYLDDAMPKWNSPTLDDGRLYAVLPGEDSPYGGFDGARATSELVCLDAASGTLLWRRSQRMGDDPAAEISFDSSPLVRDGAIHLVGRRRRAFGFEDCYLYRVRASDGVVEYRTHLGSASTGSFGNRPATRAVVAAYRDLVVVSTNLGTVTAVSARTGEVEWLRLYERVRPDGPQAIARAAQESLPWAFNAVIVEGGKVYALPGDSMNLLVLSADRGEVLGTTNRGKLAEVETLLGVHGDLLCGVGEEVFCYELGRSTMRWTATLPSGSPALGRSVWADDQLLVPRRGGLSRFRVSDGTRTDAPWDAEGEGGNLLADGDMLLAAGAGRVAAYARKSDIWKKLQEQIASSPNDPAPAVELAEVALNAGDHDEALRWLGEAVARTDRAVEPVETGLATRVFSGAVKLATVAAQRSALEVENLERLFGYASQFARSAESALRYRLVFADLFARYRQSDRAMRLYQQILRDRSLRELPVDPSRSDSAKLSVKLAGAEAQGRITELIKEHGRESYAPYEAEAKQWLASGKASGDVETLQRIVETFPNSDTAPMALMAYGELLAKAGRADAAAREFSRAYHRYPRLSDRAGLLRTIADTYEQAGMADRAYLWLTKAAREYPTATVMHGGRSMSLLQYRDRLASARVKVEPSRPRVRLPLEPAFERTFEGGFTLLSPWFGTDSSSDWSRGFVQSGGAVLAIDPKSGEDAWKEPIATGKAVELLIAREDVTVLASPHQIIGVDSRTGERRWAFGDSREKADDPGADWEAVAAFRTHTLHGQRLLSVREDGRMSSISVVTGEVYWTQMRKPSPVGRVRVTGAWLVYYVMEAGRAVLCLVDAQTGSWIDAIPTDETRPIEDFFVTLDGRIILATTQALSAYDAETKAKLWQTSGGAGIRPASLWLDIDAIYYVGEDGEARKIDLDDGGTVWSSERLIHRGEDDLRVDLVDGSLIVSTTGSVSAVDVVNGLTLWRGTTPEKCRLVARMVTREHVVAVDALPGLRPGRLAAYFYEHGNLSGIIPKDGGAPDLGTAAEIQAAMVLNDAIVVQSGATLRGFGRR